MSSSENPYASPKEQVLAAPLDRRTVLLHLRLPAVGLLSGASAMLLLYALNAMSLLLHYVLGNLQAMYAVLELLRPWWIVHLIIMVGNLCAFYASIQMLRGRQHTICLAGAFIATIPIFTPCYILGVPFAIWAAIILLRKDTRAAFAKP